MLSKFLTKVLNIERDQDKTRPSTIEESNFHRKHPGHRWYHNRQGNHVINDRSQPLWLDHPYRNNTPYQQAYEDYIENHNRYRNKQPSWKAHPNSNNNTSNWQTHGNRMEVHNVRRGRKIPRVEEPNIGYTWEHHTRRNRRNIQSPWITHPNRNNIQKYYIRTYNTEEEKPPSWTAHLRSSGDTNRNYNTRINRRQPIYRMHPKNNHIPEECQGLIRSQYRCKLHPKARHSRENCKVKCNFCKRTGLHLSIDCNVKEVVKQNFINDMISKFGLKAERLAKDLVSEWGIVMLKDIEFEQMLRLNLQKGHEKSEEKTICSFCGERDIHLDGPYILRNGILTKKRPNRQGKPTKM